MIEDNRIAANPQGVSEDKAAAERIHEAVLALPERYRDCMELFLFYEYSPKEIAKLLQVKEQSIYKRIRRGRKRLQEELRKRGLTYEN